MHGFIQRTLITQVVPSQDWYLARFRWVGEFRFTTYTNSNAATIEWILRFQWFYT